MKRMTCFVMALALVLGLAQCKKEKIEPQNEGNSVMITLDVTNGNNSGSRAEVDPPHVNFENGDQILVASGGKYVGALTRENNVFSGSITDPEEGEPLYFYFLGNKVDVETLTPGATDECTVNISDQTKVNDKPVISMGKSTDDYSSSVTSYTSRLYNKASLMKFNVTTPSTAAICITGMNNKVTVDFGKYDETGTGLGEDDTNNGFSYSMDETDGGLIKIPAKDANGVTWAIVLPRSTVLPEGEDGSAYSEDGSYIGKRPEIHVIESNKYYQNGISLSLNTHVWNGNLSILTGNEPAGFATARDGMTIYGTLTVAAQVSIAAGATVTLHDANINGSGSMNGNYHGIKCYNNVTIILEGENTVRALNGQNDGITATTLTIQGDGSLDVSGANAINGGNITILNGTINAITTSMYWGAGIKGSTITIQGGDITAESNDYAGINSTGNITIEGGTVTASGYTGIGCGQDYMSCGNIYISGGTVTATGHYYGAGIGSGYESFCGDITITEGVTQVTAIKGPDAPYSIGAGSYGECGAITIGGTTYSSGVTPNQSDGLTYIYPEPTPAEQIVDLSEITSNITLEDGDVLTGMLDGANDETKRIKISIADGATITLRNAQIIGYLTDDNSCQWAGLNCEGDATIILDDGTTNVVQGSNYAYPGIHIKNGYTLTINANGSGTGTLDARCISPGAGGAGIGAIDNTYGSGTCGNIVINGGVITATGALGYSSGSNSGLPGGAGIGGAPNTSCGTITINGGTVNATGGIFAAGIGTSSGTQDGGDYYSNCGAITITGGDVTAHGGLYAAGIGAGYNKCSSSTCNCESVTISGGTVTATGGGDENLFGAGIGSGYASTTTAKSTCGNISISTSETVTATGGKYAAGIGSGYVYGKQKQPTSSCGNIEITAGTVIATGGQYGAGIGTGYKQIMGTCSCGTITIGTGVTQVTAEKGSGATNSIGVGKNGTCGTVTIGGVEGAISDSPYTYQP